VKSKTREYLGSVTSVDRNVGRLLAALDQNGMGADTIVVFTSDNGYNIGHNGIWHKGNGHWITQDMRDLRGNDPRLQRPNMYDHSLRVPAAVRWTGRLPEKTAVTHTVTFLGKPTDWDEDMYGEYSQHHYTTVDLRMYRTPEWKLVVDKRNVGKDELYHLSEDPDEARNLVHEPSAQPIREELLRKLEARMPSK
jgi:uncharacterized sulfatase